MHRGSIGGTIKKSEPFESEPRDGFWSYCVLKPSTELEVIISINAIECSLQTEILIKGQSVFRVVHEGGVRTKQNVMGKIRLDKISGKFLELEAIPEGRVNL